MRAAARNCALSHRKVARFDESTQPSRRVALQRVTKTVFNLFKTGFKIPIVSVLVVLALWQSAYQSVLAVVTFGQQQIISSSALGASAVYAADLDGDGDMDVISASPADDTVAWYRNNGNGVFSAEIPVTTNVDYPYSIYATDLDGDGDTDILSSSFYDFRIAWFRNNGMGVFSAPLDISTTVSYPYSIFAKDLDNDGDADVLMVDANLGRVAWYRNNGTGGFSAQIVISTLVASPLSVFAADLDGDGDADVLSASGNDNKIAWYRNGGTGVFAAQSVITLSASGACSVYAADLDGDGDMDALSASVDDNKIAWYRNSGTGVFSAQLIITTLADGAMSVFAKDLDGDGDNDVLSASQSDDKIAWYPNNGTGGFAARLIISILADGAISVFATDIDGDGDMDVLSASSSDAKIASYAVGCPPIGDVYPFTAKGGTYNALCPTTFFSVLKATCEANPVSTWSPSDDPSLYPCICGPGFRQLASSTVCVPCAVGTFSDAEGVQDNCEPCPLATTTNQTEGARLNTSCTCVSGFYSLAGPGTPCTGCPKFATCQGGTNPPRPEAGYAQDRRADQFASCPRPASCLAGAGGCARGYTGYLCKDCQRGYYADASGDCRLCPPGSAAWLASYVLIVIGLSIVAALIVLLTLMKTGSAAQDNALTTAVLRARKFPPSIPLVITAFQIVGVLSLTNLSWPTSAQRALNAFNAFSLDVNLFASECSLSTFGAKYAVSLATPAVFAILVVVELLLLRIAKRFVPFLSKFADVALGHQLLAVLFLVGPLAYLPLARSTLVLFDCTRLPNGKFYLDADMSVQCFSERWWSLLPIGLAGLLAYILAIPGAIGVTLLIHRAELFSDIAVVRAYGSVYKLFRRPFTFMPVALLGKKLAIALCSLFLSRVQAFQFAGLFLVILGAGMLQMQFQPYYFPVYDRMELAFTLLLSTVLVCGMMMYSSSRGGGSHDPSMFIIVVVAICIAALLLFSVYFVVRDVRGILEDRRALRNGATPDNQTSSHAKRVLASTMSNLRDIDNPAAFLSLMLPDDKAFGLEHDARAPDLTEHFDGSRRLTIGNVEMSDL